MIVEEIGAAKLDPRQPRRWGDLHKGDVIICPHDGLPEAVLRSSLGRRGRQVVEMGSEDREGIYPTHTHTRPASDTVETPS